MEFFEINKSKKRIVDFDIIMRTKLIYEYEDCISLIEKELSKIVL